MVGVGVVGVGVVGVAVVGVVVTVGVVVVVGVVVAVGDFDALCVGVGDFDGLCVGVGDFDGDAFTVVGPRLTPGLPPPKLLVGCAVFTGGFVLWPAGADVV